MANKPSQPCRCCHLRGWLYGQRPGMESQCPLCHGFGRITIRIARLLGWYPVTHRKRPERAKQLLLLGGAESLDEEQAHNALLSIDWGSSEEASPVKQSKENH